MIEALLAVIDRLIQIVQTRIAGRKEMFDRVLEPVFNDLVVIHGYYIRMFDEVSERLHPNNPSELNAARAELRRRRLEFEPVRRKVEALMNQLESTQLPVEERAFVTAVIAYFGFTKFVGEKQENTSAATRALEYFDEAENAGAIWSHMWEATRALRERWSEITIAFAALKITIAKLR